MDDVHDSRRCINVRSRSDLIDTSLEISEWLRLESSAAFLQVTNTKFPDGPYTSRPELTLKLQFRQQGHISRMHRQAQALMGCTVEGWDD